MRLFATCLFNMLLTLGHGGAGATSAATLRDDVLSLSATMLEGVNLHVDTARARLLLSRAIEDHETFSLVPLWNAGDDAPPLPLTFELVGGPGHAGRAKVTLLATLERDTLVLRRRLDRGAVLGCGDVEVRRKPLRTVPPRSLVPPCVLEGSPMLGRTMAAGDVLRSDDIGGLPDVPAMAPVRVRVVQGAVVLEHAGVALADARVGERVKVRLNGSQRQVTGRVLAASTVVLEGSQ